MKLSATQLRRIIAEEVKEVNQAPRRKGTPAYKGPTSAEGPLGGPSRAKKGIAEPKSDAYKVIKQTHSRLLAAVLASPKRDAFIQQFINDEDWATTHGSGFDGLDAIALLADFANEVV